MNMENLEWVRGPLVGRGSFAAVNLVKPRNISSQFLPTTVVKSSELPHSESLKSEKQALLDVGETAEIVRYLGDCTSNESGRTLYNLFFEYAEKGSLEDQLKSVGGKFQECDVRRYTKAIVKGLSHIHEKGYVHCDIKLQNVLLFGNGAVKIADFGLSVKDEGKKRHQYGGTPLYMSPELIADGEVRPPADIWALGCAVVYMVTGESAWDVSSECNANALIWRIGFGLESPKIPECISSEGRDFISKCFIQDPKERWTARMLLDLPFLDGFDCGNRETSVSPRDPFEFSGLEFVEPLSLDSISCGSGFETRNPGDTSSEGDSRSSICCRLGEMASHVVPDWSDSNGWVDVR